MGASASSTRRLTVKNDDPRIIQVTEDVVNRLRSSTMPPPPKGSTPPLSTADPASYFEPSTIADENEEPLRPSSSNPSGSSTQTAGILNIGSTGHPVIETVSAYKVRQQKEQEIRQNDQLWLAKLRELESRYVASAFASQEEFNTKLESLQQLVPKSKDEASCKILGSKVAECYSLNASQPLRCSEEVKSFAQCVERTRAA